MRQTEAGSLALSNPNFLIAMTEQVDELPGLEQSSNSLLGFDVIIYALTRPQKATKLISATLLGWVVGSNRILLTNSFKTVLDLLFRTTWCISTTQG